MLFCCVGLFFGMALSVMILFSLPMTPLPKKNVVQALISIINLIFVESQNEGSDPYWWLSCVFSSDLLNCIT